MIIPYPINLVILILITFIHLVKFEEKKIDFPTSEMCLFFFGTKRVYCH
jgi:hypothetical protein